ncbi:MAG: hypothetical protein Kow00123_20560 [Anaerolineales bacterium]
MAGKQMFGDDARVGQRLPYASHNPAACPVEQRFRWKLREADHSAQPPVPDHMRALEGRLRTSENAVSGAPKATVDPRPDSPERISGISTEMYTLPTGKIR